MDNNDLVREISEPSGEGIADIYSALRFNGEHHLKFHANLTHDLTLVLVDSCVGRGYFKQGRTCRIGNDQCLECTGVRELDYRRTDLRSRHTLSWALQNCNGSVSIEIILSIVVFFLMSLLDPLQQHRLRRSDLVPEGYTAEHVPIRF